MTGLEGYGSPAAVESAIGDAAKRAHAADPSLTVQERIRLECFHRFLCRVFSEGADGWVLKGGTSMLARVASARSTTDMDLFCQTGSLEAALTDLRRLAAVRLADFFRFEHAGHSLAIEGNQQPHAEGYRVTFDAYIGAKKKDSFHVDLAVNVVVTAEPEIAPANWGGRYAKLAGQIPVCDQYRSVESAMRLMHTFLDPVFAREIVDEVWDHVRLAWV